MKKFLLSLVGLLGLGNIASAEEVLVDFSKQGFSSNAVVSEVQVDNVVVTFDTGTGSAAPKYSSSSVYLYTGNTMKVSVTKKGYVITNIAFSCSDNSSSFTDATQVSDGTLVSGKNATWSSEEGVKQIDFYPVSQGGTNVRIKTMTITYGKMVDYPYTDVTLSYPQAECVVDIDEMDSFEAPVLSCDPEEALSVVTYESSNPNVAVINTLGQITILGTGITTITASIPEEDETYSGIPVSYDLEVTSTALMQTFLTPNDFFGYTSASTTHKFFEVQDQNTQIKYSAYFGTKNQNGSFTYYFDGGKKGCGITVTQPNPDYLIKRIIIDFNSGDGTLDVYKKDVEFVQKKDVVISLDGATKVNDEPINSEMTLDINDQAFAIIPTGKVYLNSVTVICEYVSPDAGAAYKCEDFKDYMICEGETVELNLGADAPDVNYLSTDESVAVVEGNTIKAVGPGFTTIAARWDAVDGKWRAGAEVFTVNVKYKDLATVLANVKEGQTYVGNFDVILVSDNGNYNYVTDEGRTGWALFYIDHNHGDGAVIPAGWCGVYTEAYGVPQFDIISHDDVDETVTKEVKLNEYSDIEITEAMRNEVLVLLDVTFAEDAPAEEGEFTGKFNGKEYTFYNLLECAGAEAGTYNVKGVVDIDPDRGLEILPIEYYTPEATAAPSHNETKTYMAGDPIEFTGVEEGAHILYRHGGEEPDHNNVFTESPDAAPRKAVFADVNTELTYNNTTHPLIFNGNALNVKYVAKKPGKAPSAVQTLAVDGDGNTTGIENVAVDAACVETEYFNLQGQRVDNPASGLYIMRQGNKVRKVIVK